MAWWTRKIPNGKPAREWPPSSTLVRVMTRAQGYAMVRFTGCMPFVVSEKEIKTVTPEADA
jgi:hypothetical protein